MASTRGRRASTARSNPVATVSVDSLAGGGEAGKLARSIDWAQTPIGPVDGWSQALRSTASLVLHNHSGMLLWWGPEFVQIYNDAYTPVLGDKHPRAMGQRFHDCWSEVFHILGPMAERPFRGGPASTSDDIAVPINRKVHREEAHFRLAYSPVPDETVQSTGIGGVLATVAEITEQAYADRQSRTLRELGARSAAHGTTVEQACAVVAATLAENAWDVPFALFYLLDEGGTRARLVSSAGFKEHSTEDVTPGEIDFSAAADPSSWPILQVAKERRVEIITSLSTSPEALPASPWSDPPRSAIALPLASPEQPYAYGVLVCGVSPHRVLDAGYRAFFELAAAQIVTAIRNARALEEERKRAEALAAIDRAKTAFFSNVSHEFRTPLTLMLGPIEEAAADPVTTPSVRAKLALAHRNSLRLLKLVNSLLDFARIEAGRVQASYEPTDLACLTRELSSTFHSAMERAGLIYSVECDELDEPVYVDREMWEKIVLNLLSNAFKFTFDGGVTVRLQRKAGDAVLEIADTGVGVPEHELRRLFERFHRVEGAAGRTQEGSGIGLALVQELVKLHSGTIAVESALGTGTTLRVAIPFGSRHLPAERIRTSRPHTSTAVGAQAFVQEALRWIPSGPEHSVAKLPASLDSETPPLDRRFAQTAGARIVLADDNADMRAYLYGLLSPGYEVEAVADGEQALQAARRERPDLILSDIMMPRLDGHALLKALRNDEGLRDIPVVLLSARAGEEARVEGLDAGADDYLVKPFSARELLARVGALLELTRMRRENEERFRAFVSATSDAIYRMSPDWTEMRFLKGRNFIADTEDASGTWLEKYIPSDEQPHVMAVIAEAIRTKSIFQLEHRVRRVDGAVGWAFSRAIPLKNANGEIIEWFGAASDVTERKLTELRLVQAREFAEETNRRLQASEETLREEDRRKNEFLALLGHELRNPLSPISTASEVLSRALAEDGRAQRMIDLIKRQAAQLSRLVDDLLDIGRITQGRIHLRRAPVDLANVIAQAVETVERQVREKEHKLSITSSYEPLYVEGDYARLVQCVLNLLTNAVKYTDANGEIRIQTRAERASAVIEIMDNGVGLSAELLPRVFDLFVQSDRTLDRAQGGLGIGLSVVKRLVEMHGGEVIARSAGIGRGATFEIRLPRIARPQAPKPEPVAVGARPRRVLIVDDNEDAAMSLAALLDFMGHEVKAVCSSKDALACAESFKADVALLDIGLPEMDGYELAKRLRAMPPLSDIRLVALTGYGQAEDREHARAAGFDDHLVKPAELRALERTLAGLSGRDEVTKNQT